MDFAYLAEIFARLETTTKRLELTDELAKLFANAQPSEVRILAYLCRGVLVPEHEGIQLGMGDKLCEQAIALVSGQPQKEVSALYRKTGDLGDAANILLEQKKQLSLGSSGLSVSKVYENFFKIATASGSGSQQHKIRLLAELLSNSRPQDAKIIVRFALGSLRLGIGEPTILDALSVARAGDKSLRPDLERAFNLRSDLGLVAETFLSKGIEQIKAITPKPFSPIRPALAERLPDAKAIIEKLGECAVEAKLDGFRLQVHKSGSQVKIFSRRQEPMTQMFPDLVEAVRLQVKEKEAIFEGEAIAFNESTGEFLPFQATIQRKRKHGVAEKTRELPLKLFVFEVLYLDGSDCTQLPYSQRRKLLEKMLGFTKYQKQTGNNADKKTIAPASLKMCSTAEQLQAFFNECVGAGLEGIIAKDLNAPYTAGARKFAWIKLKRSYAGGLADTIDAVIIGYYLGKGKRTEFGFGGILTAVYSPSDGKFRSIAKVGTGFTEQEMTDYQKALEKLRVARKPVEVESLLEPDVWVTPSVVVTLTADELTRSPVHLACAGMLKKRLNPAGRADAGTNERNSEGLALRFPRLTALRTDKAPQDATTEEEILEMYEMQATTRSAAAAQTEEKE